MQPVKLAMTKSGHMWSVKPGILQTGHMRSMSKAARAQLGIQPEVVRNSKHAVLPTHDPYVNYQLMFQDSTSKHFYRAVSENVCPDSRSYKITTIWSVNLVKMQSCHIWPVNTDLKKKSQVNTKSQVQTSTFKRAHLALIKAWSLDSVHLSCIRMDVYSVTVYTHDHQIKLVHT